MNFPPRNPRSMGKLASQTDSLQEISKSMHVVSTSPGAIIEGHAAAVSDTISEFKLILELISPQRANIGPPPIPERSPLRPRPYPLPITTPWPSSSPRLMAKDMNVLLESFSSVEDGPGDVLMRDSIEKKGSAANPLTTKSKIHKSRIPIAISAKPCYLKEPFDPQNTVTIPTKRKSRIPIAIVISNRIPIIIPIPAPKKNATRRKKCTACLPNNQDSRKNQRHPFKKPSRGRLMTIAKKGESRIPGPLVKGHGYRTSEHRFGAVWWSYYGRSDEGSVERHSHLIGK